MSLEEIVETAQQAIDAGYRTIVLQSGEDPYFNGDKTQLVLHKAILKLPDKQRAVFNMRYFDEMKYEEISEVTGTSVGALKASYHHAFQKIQQAMEELL